jgi:hypothetical protein
MDAIARRCPGAALAAALVLAAALPGHAAASASQESIVMDDNLLLYRGKAVAEETLAELKSLGVDRVRVNVLWKAVAPYAASPRVPGGFTDARDPRQYPHALFDSFDRVVLGAGKVGLKVLFTVTGPAPLWATGRVGGKRVSQLYDPQPAAFGRFVEMLGRRYDGTYIDENEGSQKLPRVSAWAIWNEPNQAGWLQPQWRRSAAGSWTPYAPRLYRALARAAIAGLRRAGHREDTVLLGETAPLGRDRRGARGSMRPGPFLRSLFCLDDALRPLAGAPARAGGCDFQTRGGLDVTGYAHHPYSVRSPPGRADAERDDIRLADRDRLVALLDAAAGAGRLPADLPIWWTEYGYQTNPPDPLRGVSLDQHARWIAEAENMAWRDPRAAAMTQFLLRDDDPRHEYPADHPRHWSTYQSGLLFADGRRKPAYDSYRLPFYAPAVAATGARVAVWGRVRPHGGVEQTVQLQFAPDGSSSFQDVGSPVRTDARGYFQVEVTPGGSGSWRFRWSPPHDPGLVPDVAAPLELPALPPPVGPEPVPVYFSAAVPVRIASG